MTTKREFEGGHPLETMLDRYRTGELTAEEGDLAKSHLEACPECRDRFAELEAFAATVREGYEAADRRIPESEWNRRRGEIAARTYRRERGRVVAPRWWRVAPQFAAAAIAVIVAGVIVRSGVRGPDEVDLLGPGPGTEISAIAEAPDEAKDETERIGETVAAIPPDEAAEEAPPALLDREVDPATVLRQDRQALDQAAPLDAGQVADAGEAIGAEGVRVGEAEEDRFRVMAEAEGPDRTEALRAAAVDRRARFEELARDALARSDSLAAVHALAFWRDSLVEDERRGNERETGGWIDSLAAVAGEPPAEP